MDVDMRYPIGKYERADSLTLAQRAACIDTIDETPSHLAAAIAGLTDTQLDTPYRPGGWTVRQVVHHLADSHMQAYARFKFALAENEPTIKAYDEAVWAEIADAKTAPVEISLALLENLHQRWVILLRSLSDSDLARTYRHPERGVVKLEENIGLCAWHGWHHVAHISFLREQKSWK